jgi:hypothetical protein
MWKNWTAELGVHPGSMRVDDDYRIIVWKESPRRATVLFVGKHDIAYRFANTWRQEIYGLPALQGDAQSFLDKLFAKKDLERALSFIQDAENLVAGAGINPLPPLSQPSTYR